MTKSGLRITALTLALATALAGGPVFAQAQQQAEPKKAETPTYAGKWDLSMQSPQGPFAAVVTIAIDAKDPTKVTGSMASEMGLFPVTGEIAEGVLWFAISPDGSMEIWLNGSLQEDGTLKGSLDVQGNVIPWTAKRAK